MMLKARPAAGPASRLSLGQPSMQAAPDSGL